MTRYVMRDYFPTLHTLVILLLGVYVTEELPTNYNTMGDQLVSCLFDVYISTMILLSKP